GSVACDHTGCPKSQSERSQWGDGRGRLEYGPGRAPTCAHRRQFDQSTGPTTSIHCPAGSAHGQVQDGAGNWNLSCSGTITLTSQIDINSGQDVTINGTGQSVTISGGGRNRIFDVTGGTLDLS